MTLRTQGFTLIELSIVLVIIGLIVGGVLVGRDLITAAQIRAQITQIEQINAAANTFRGKYNQLPGDLNTAHGTALGLNYVDFGVGTTEDGYIDAPAANTFESPVFAYNLTETHLYSCPVCANTGNWYDGINPAKIGGSNVVYVYGGPPPVGWAPADTYTKNYIEIGADDESGGKLALTPVQAFALDAKMDDGLPLTGRVVGRDTHIQGTTMGFWGSPFDGINHRSVTSGAAGTANCVSTSSTPNVYNTTNNGFLCNARFDAQF